MLMIFFLIQINYQCQQMFFLIIKCECVCVQVSAFMAFCAFLQVCVYDAFIFNLNILKDLGVISVIFNIFSPEDIQTTFLKTLNVVIICESRTPMSIYYVNLLLFNLNSLSTILKSSPYIHVIACGQHVVI